MELVSEENCKKRRRTKNTSPEQYELYLNYLESDYYFRSNTMNPTLGDNYLKDKWKELSDRLNSLGQGPCLSVQEWMKRFTDWKNSTRAKYRKIGECRIKTGGGPEIKVELTPFEERGLACWGKVTVEETKLVKDTGGLGRLSQPLDHEYTVSSDQIFEEPIMIIESELEQPEESVKEVEDIIAKRPPLKQKIVNQRTRKHTRETRKSRYETVANELISSCNFTTNSQQKLLENKYTLEKERLRFEIEKFKFLNPDFRFDLQL